jgi:hypothetical protein
MKDIDKFIDFLTKNISITFIKKHDGNDILILKNFEHKTSEYEIITRFYKGDYVSGYLIKDGECIINGKGFSMNSFNNLIKMELKNELMRRIQKQ